MKIRGLLLPTLLAGLLFGSYTLLQGSSLLTGQVGEVLRLILGKDLQYLYFAAWVALVTAVVRFLDTVFFDLIFSRRGDFAAPIMLREMISFALYVVLVGSLASWIFHTNVTALLATTTVLAAVIGLALQDTLGNLFSGISLHLERTFEIGDVIRLGEHIGVVEEVTWRATRIRTFENFIVVMPNSVLSREQLEVFSQTNLNAHLVHVGAPYDVPPAKVIEILQGAARNVDGVDPEIPLLARVREFGESSILYEVKYWTRRYELRDTIDADIRRAVWYALQRNGISIPFPIRTLHRYAPTALPPRVTIEDAVSRINSVDILAPLSPEEHRALANDAKTHYYSRGETILRKGQAGDSMFLVHEGTVSVRIPADDGAQEIAQLGAGSFFGEMALLTGEARTADVIALTDVVAFEIGKASLQAILAGAPELASALSQKVIERRAAAEASLLAEEEEETSILGRIRAYFGLR